MSFQELLLPGATPAFRYPTLTEDLCDQRSEKLVKAAGSRSRYPHRDIPDGYPCLTSTIRLTAFFRSCVLLSRPEQGRSRMASAYALPAMAETISPHTHGHSHGHGHSHSHARSHRRQHGPSASYAFIPESLSSSPHAHSRSDPYARNNQSQPSFGHANHEHFQSNGRLNPLQNNGSANGHAKAMDLSPMSEVAIQGADDVPSDYGFPDVSGKAHSNVQSRVHARENPSSR